ncbi:hypothetical protein KBY75_12980 [Cyanobium sp. T1G-Tous]|uniref:hypothetical protein n=1 Tax=Cyanobium sp. T1G-Tous TaxID=2823722 RepID=UPI0020CF1A74|nr:hypothetical protein [Cyanobium sp. T1G-Tous]MCP9804480.1 hypothetical protein [Cyanobium sp. T1G-Tous]
MTDSSTPGSLYFITERDPFGDPNGSYVKIGLVRENETGRSSFDRLLEHQTGNPRILVVADSLTTTAPISELEASVHQQLARHRVSGEWFRAGGEGIRPFVDVAEAIRRELEHLHTHSSALETLAATEDTGEELLLDSEANDMHHEMVGVVRAIKERKQKLNRVALELQSLGGTETSDIEGICGHHYTNAGRRFDSSGFAQAYPDLISELGSSRIKSRFSLRQAPTLTPSADMELLKELCAAQSIAGSKPLKLARSSRAEALHADWIELHSGLHPLKQKEDLLEARMKLLCGPAAAVKGICSWKRTTIRTISQKELLPSHQELVDAFTKPTASSWSFKVNPWRPYRF